MASRAEPGGPKGELREIDGLRGIAITLVLVHRLWPRSGPLARYSAFADLGWIGVDLFFAVSGMLIGGILLDTRGEPAFFRNFYARRALRIFPLYYLVVALAFCLFPLLEGGGFWSSPFVRESGSPLWYLLYLGNLHEAWVGHEPPYVLGTLWSLSIEEQFYLSFPIVVAVLGPRRLGWALAAMIVGAPAVRLSTMLVWPADERVQYLATPCRLDVIALGVLVALWLRSAARQPSRRAVAALVAISLPTLAVAFAQGGLDRTTPFGRTLGYTLVAVAAASVVLFAVTHRELGSTAWLRARPLRALGKLCYGLYLLHRPAGAVVARLTARLGDDGASVGLARMVLGFAVAVLLAAGSYRVLERPLLRLKSRFASAGHPQGGPEVAVAPEIAA